MSDSVDVSNISVSFSGDDDEFWLGWGVSLSINGVDVVGVGESGVSSLLITGVDVLGVWIVDGWDVDSDGDGHRVEVGDGDGYRVEAGDGDGDLDGGGDGNGDADDDDFIILGRLGGGIGVNVELTVLNVSSREVCCVLGRVWFVSIGNSSISDIAGSILFVCLFLRKHKVHRKIKITNKDMIVPKTNELFCVTVCGWMLSMMRGAVDDMSIVTVACVVNCLFIRESVNKKNKKINKKNV